MCRLQTFLGLFLVIAVVAVPGVFAGAMKRTGFAHFITRNGGRLMDGDDEVELYFRQTKD